MKPLEEAETPGQNLQMHLDLLNANVHYYVGVSGIDSPMVYRSLCLVACQLRTSSIDVEASVVRAILRDSRI